MTDERVKVSLEEALKRIGKGKRIHTFLQGPMDILIGADWNRKDLIASIKQHGIEESGPAATAAGHGLVILRGDGDSPLFVATQADLPEAKLYDGVIERESGVGA